jgi:ATP-dependent DNA helicase DinG
MFPFRFVPNRYLSAMSGSSPRLRLTGVSLAGLPALASPPGAGAICDGDGARKIGRGAAEGAFATAPVMVAHASLTARRLGIAPPARSADLLDVLELFAFVRPARFCAPSPSGGPP